MKMNKIKIEIESKFLSELSNNDEALFYFLYNVKIYNHGKNKVKLISRHWNIQDALGRKKNIDGEGVIGVKPTIEPGNCFEYSSYCPLKTDSGIMDGFYTMRDEKGQLFKALIPLFGLIAPNTIN